MGAEKEVDQLEQTIIALYWLYYIDRLANGKGGFVDPPFHLNLIGPEVPFDAYKSLTRAYPVTAHMYRGLYHEVKGCLLYTSDAADE